MNVGYAYTIWLASYWVVSKHKIALLGVGSSVALVSPDSC